MIHKNWAELIKPTQLEVKPGADSARVATVATSARRRAIQRSGSARRDSQSHSVPPRCPRTVTRRRDCRSMQISGTATATSPSTGATRHHCPLSYASAFSAVV